MFAAAEAELAGLTDRARRAKPLRSLLAFPVPSAGGGATRELERHNIAYLGLESLCPHLATLFGLRPVLGVRTVVNSLARSLNPLAAPCQLLGVFHPPTARCSRRLPEPWSSPGR